MSILTNHPQDSLTPSSGVLTIGGTGSVALPSGNNSQRPVALAVGQIRFSTDANTIEVYDGTDWNSFANKNYIDLVTESLQSQIDNIISNTDPETLNSLGQLLTSYQNVDGNLVTSLVDVSSSIATLTTQSETQSVQISELSSQASEESASRIESNESLQSQIDAVEQNLFTLPAGSKGQVPFVQTQGTNEFNLGYTLVTGSFIENNNERTALEGLVPSLQDVIDSWGRFSHDSDVVQPANLPDQQAWSYESLTNRLVNTNNTTTYTGLYSPDQYQSYTHEVRVSSPHFDNDAIGVLLAWHVDPDSGKEYTLSALRSPGGIGYTWAVFYNFGRSDQQLINNGTSSVKWGNSNLGSSAEAANYVGTEGWDVFLTGAKIKVIRNNNIITCQTTDLGEETYLPGSNLVINLSNQEILNKFQGARSYGYGAFSQANAKIEVLDFPDVASTVYDVRDGLVYTFLNSSWNVVSGTSVVEEIGAGKFAHNLSTGKTFYIGSNGNITRIGNTAEECLQINVLPSDLDDADVIAGTSKYTFRAPFAMTLTKLPRVSVKTESSLGPVVVDINANGISLFSSNKLTIDEGQRTSTTSSTAVELTTNAIDDDDEITIDVDLAGTGAKGLKINLYYRK